MSVDVKRYRDVSRAEMEHVERLARKVHAVMTDPDHFDYTETLPTAPVMALALRDDAELPSGPVRLRGFPW